MTFNTLPKREGTTYSFSGPTMLHLIVNEDESGLIRELFVTATASGSTTHTLCDALGRVISIALQHNPDLIKKISLTLRDISSETVWTNGKLGQAKSIPDAIALALGEMHGHN